ncbi:glycosyltransferase [Salinimicrobium oceani]|uniref:Glycosyltransferase family 4 protein n=1 Tax=Salinimicrobium oceani TaxID=2722702 RepID=A0ABX1CZN8_9FLAO|nr:glycosyltransferase [Salinimicrobium oceani]NJW53460.1 glycosyltransferase family 4 protein [Salinimicrobium oceani]
MPRSSSAWEGAEALWITAAGWAVAAEQILGKAVVVTSDKISKPKEVYNFPLIREKNRRKARVWEQFIPVFFKIFYHDLLTWKKNRNWGIIEKLEVEREDVKLVWEKHDLYKGPGRKLADELGVPLISYVHAPVVWEASRWGVKRFFWGRFLENLEAKNLRKADIVAVVSEEVRNKVLKMGVPANKIIISPMAVDISLFSKGYSEHILDELKLEDKFVIGWTGSFRNFHGLDHVIKAFKKVVTEHSHARLMLIGDGAERLRSEDLVDALNIRDKVIFTGRKKFRDIPCLISLFDMAIVSARSAEEFHYSPLKLREYMAAGKPVLAPKAGEITSTFKEGESIKLFDAGDINSIRQGITFFLEDPESRKRIACNGYNFIKIAGTWEIEVKKALKKIGELNSSVS